MSQYQVLARKHRPQCFKEVIAQEATVTTLKNAIHLGRIAHAYLFCGSHGTGKTTLARLFAKALNCTQLTEEGEPCNQCASCLEITSGQALDVLEIDGASHRGIEDIRQLNETVHFVPSYSKYKIYLIDEVHMLTKEAFNAILKTLEEPPSHVKFFFATTEPHKIPATVLSRCQRFNLHRIPLEKISSKLEALTKELELTVEHSVFNTLATLSEGSLRDAQSLLDQILSSNEKHLTQEKVAALLGLPSYELFFSFDEAGHKGNLATAFTLAHDVFSSGKHMGFFLEELLNHFRTLFLLQQGIPPARDLVRYQQSLTYYRKAQLVDILEMVAEAQQTVRFALSEKTALEMLLLRILRTHSQVSLDQLVERLYALEQKLTVEATSDLITPLPSIENKPDKPEESPPSALVLAGGEKSRETTLRPAVCTDTLLHFAAKELNGSLGSKSPMEKSATPNKKKE